MPFCLRIYYLPFTNLVVTVSQTQYCETCQESCSVQRCCKMILGAASRITSTPSIIFDRWINDFEKWTRAVQRAPDIFTKCIDLRSLASRIRVTRNFKRFRAISFLEKYFEKKKRREKTKTKFPTLNEKNIEMFNEENCYFFNRIS